MNFDLSEEQNLLAEQARKLFAAQSGYDRLRGLIDANQPWDEPLWHEMSGLGFLGAAIPERYGGLGLTDLELAVVAQELGRANAAVPFTSSIVLAAEALRLAGNDTQKSEWLPQIAAGEVVATFAHAEGIGTGPATLSTCTFNGRALSGDKWPVPDAIIADIAIVLAAEAGHPVLALVDLRSEGITRTPLVSFDQLRSHARLELNAAPAQLLAGDGQIGMESIIRRIFDRAAVITAFEQCGGAEACLYMARDHTMNRQIFGRPLASYQAMKHKLADILVRLEIARSNAYFGGWALVNNARELAASAACARISACEAFELAAQENLQAHGGIGYTFAANCHFYYRRERLLAAALGGVSEWSDRLMDALGIAASEVR